MYTSHKIRDNHSQINTSFVIVIKLEEIIILTLITIYIKFLVDQIISCNTVFNVTASLRQRL